MSKQTTSTAAPKKRPGWKLPLAALAAAGLLLTAQGFGVFGNFANTLDESGSGSAEESAAGPQQIVDEAAAAFADISGSAEADTSGATGAAAGAQAAAEAQAEGAQSDLEARIAEVRAQVDAEQEASLARAEAAKADAEAELDAVASGSGLPELPEDHFSGMPVDIPTTSVDSFDVPAFGTDALGGFSDTPWDAVSSGLQADESLPVPETGEGDLDEGASEINNAYRTAKQTILSEGGDGGDGTGDETVDDLIEEGKGLAEELAGPLPEEGPAGADDLFSTVERVDDMLEPDEEGALFAQEHASQIIGTGDAVLDQRIAGLQAVIDDHYTFVEQTRSDLEGAHEDALTAEADIMLELEARLAEALEEADARQTQLNRRIDAASSDAEQTVQSTKADLQAAYQAEADALTAASSDAAGELESEAKAILGEAEVKQAEIQGQAKASLEELQRLEAADGADYSAYAEAVVEEALAAEKTVWADAKAQSDVLAAEAEDIRAETDARITDLGSRLGDAQVDLEAKAADLRSELEDRHAYAVAYAQAEGEAVVAANQAEADDATRLVQERFDAYRAAVLDGASAYQAEAEAWVGEVEDLADTIGEKSDLYVHEDVEYILQVAEDYAVHDQTTPDEEDRGAHWQAVAETLNSSVEFVLADAYDAKSLVPDAQGSLGAGRIALEELAFQF